MPLKTFDHLRASKPVDTMFTISSSSRALEQLFEAPETYSMPRHETPQEARLRACLSGELPAGSLPTLAGERPGPPVSRQQLISDLESVVGHLTQHRQHFKGPGGLLCFCATSLIDELQRNRYLDAAHATKLLATARTLSRCQDAREQWPVIQHALLKKMNESGNDALLVSRWQRLNTLANDVLREADDPGIDPKNAELLRQEHLSDLRKRTDSLAQRTTTLLSTAAAFSMLAIPPKLNDGALRTVLVEYEEIVAEAVRRATLRGGPAAQAEVARHISAYDSMREEVLCLDDQMCAMRQALLGAQTPPVFDDAPRRRLPVTMAALPRPSSSSSLSSSDNEGVPDPRIPVTGFNDLFERG